MATTPTSVLVTGGNNGIGLATCELLASQPNYHVIMGSRSLDKGHSAIASIKSSVHSSSNLSLVQLDITSDDSIAAAVEATKSLLGNDGHLSVLINNAGICPTDFTRATLREALETNAISPALVTKAFAPLLLASPIPAKVIYVTSVLGSITSRADPKNMAYQAEYSAYRTSKAALNMLTVCDSVEYEGRMKVWAFCPGYVVTDLAGERESKIQAGFAKGADTSAKGILAILEGKRDGEVGRFVHGGVDTGAEGVYAW